MNQTVSQMKKLSILIVLICSNVFIANSHKAKISVTKNKPEPIARWSGTIQLDETVIFNNLNLRGKGERHMSATFINALPTLYRDDETTDLNFTDDKGTGINSFHSKTKFLNDKGELISEGCTDCQGSGQAELHSVVVREWDNTYDIEVIPPDCTGTNCDGTTYGPEAKSITIGNHPLKNRDILDGSITRTGELVGDYGTFTTTIIWHFERVKEDDVELIVTPVDYDTWLPEPGKDELTRGKVMSVNLKLQGKNGKPLKAKAESFELRLNNTSIEPGITINYPVEPDPNQLPDLRFLLHPSIESLDPDQFVSIGSPDGITGKAMIASYDGGGWSVLTAEAILKDGRKIQGRLLKPGGEIDIRIPKRDPNSHIGEAWLKKYKNPGEMDDIEKSDDNNFKGDGLTAYEEYRGVVAEVKFKRLDPTKKELGILASQKNFSLFGEGMTWFKSASDLELIRFDINKKEIPIDNRLNNNAKTSHDFDQYVVYITNGPIYKPGVLGICYGKRNPMIPANVNNVVIDWDYIQISFQNKVIEVKPASLKFNLREYLAQTVAHELGHAVNVKHHGTDKSGGPWKYELPADSNRVRIFNAFGKQITNCSCVLDNVGPSKGSVESGNMLCMLNYYPYYSWGITIGADGAYIYNGVPLLPLGQIFCKSRDGTGINMTKLYFGAAAEDKGNCFGQIQLRN
jgi:hypothetical protein